jgi:hypothetical protein
MSAEIRTKISACFPAVALGLLLAIYFALPTGWFVPGDEEAESYGLRPQRPAAKDSGILQGTINDESEQLVAMRGTHLDLHGSILYRGSMNGIVLFLDGNPLGTIRGEATKESENGWHQQNWYAVMLVQAIEPGTHEISAAAHTDAGAIEFARKKLLVVE